MRVAVGAEKATGTCQRWRLNQRPLTPPQCRIILVPSSKISPYLIPQPRLVPRELPHSLPVPHDVRRGLNSWSRRIFHRSPYALNTFDPWKWWTAWFSTNPMFCFSNNARSCQCRTASMYGALHRFTSGAVFAFPTSPNAMCQSADPRMHTSSNPPTVSNALRRNAQAPPVAPGPPTHNAHMKHHLKRLRHGSRAGTQNYAWFDKAYVEQTDPSNC